MAILGQTTIDQISILSVDTDPTSSGVAARLGSVAFLDNSVLGAMWIKTASGDTGWTPVPRLPTGTTSLQNNAIVYTDPSGFIKTDTTKMIWEPTAARLGIGLAAPAVPQSTIHIDRGTATGGHVRFTAGSTTGQTSGDGLEIGIDDAGNAEIKQYENLPVNILANNTRYLQLTATGQFLIGAGVAAVDITGASIFPAFQIVGTSPFATQMAAITFSNDANPSVFNLLKSRGALNAQGLLADSDELGRLQFRGSDGVNFQAGASVRAAVDGTPSAGSMPGRLLLMTTPSGSASPVERMRISQNGLVKVADAFQSFRRITDFTSTATSAGTITLTSASAGVQIFTGTSTGQIVRLPDATTLTVGALYEIHNNSTKNIAIQDNAGTALETGFSGTGTVIARLLTNGTAAGTWLTRSRFEAYEDEVSSTSGMSIGSTTDVLITRMTITPPAGTYHVFFDASVTVGTSASTLGFAVYAGGTINTNSNKSFTAVSTVTPGAPYYGTQGTVTVDGTQAIEIRGRRSAGATTVGVRTMHIRRTG